jgi:hypothetical protein
LFCVSLLELMVVLRNAHRRQVSHIGNQAATASVTAFGAQLSSSLLLFRCPVRSQSVHRRIMWCHQIVILALIVLLLQPHNNINFFAVMAIDVSWTPNPQDDGGGGPLPLSMKQRQQLLQLEQTIRNSPDPAATLEKVAASNHMSASDLSNMLQRNHADMATATTAKDDNRMPSNVLWNTMTSLVGILWQVTRQHPKVVSLLILSFWTVWYISTSVVPQTGGVINADSPRSYWTKGPTTIWYPPTAYMEQLLDQSKLFQFTTNDDDDDGVEDPIHDTDKKQLSYADPRRNQKTPSDLWKCVDFDTYDRNCEASERLDVVTTTTWHPKNSPTKLNPAPATQKKLQLVVTSHQMIDIAKLALRIQKSRAKRYNKVDNGDDDGDDDNDNNRALMETILDWCLLHGARLCHQPNDITEWTNANNNDSDGNQHPQRRVKLLTTTDTTNSKGILIVPGMGDWGRYGLLPLHIDTAAVNDDDEEDDLHLTLTVASGGHWDGQIHIAIVPLQPSKPNDDDNVDMDLPTKIVVRVSIVVPEKAKAPSQQVAVLITEYIVRSMVASIQMRTQQSVARSMQSQQYSQSAHDRAQYRRTNRNVLERQMEDMAIDRRRRWQRQNPSGVSNYRPSGERMRSPNNSVSFK